jgi:secondary thiamine-phosphate synthase enzyme
MQELTVSTHSRVEMVDITNQVAAIVDRTNIAEGHCLVFCPHTTAGVIINEHADPDVTRDISHILSRLVPAHDHSYHHLEGNADAHIKATLVGNSVQLIVQNGRLLLGTWQGIFLCEFDGPRTRKVWISVR